MQAHGNLASLGAGPASSSARRCPTGTCLTGVSPTPVGATNRPMPCHAWLDSKQTMKPRVGQVWKIDESIFSPVAQYLGEAMPALMSTSVTSFQTDRLSKERPCWIYEDSGKGYRVWLMGTFGLGRQGDIEDLPTAMRHFLMQVDPHIHDASQPRYPSEPGKPKPSPLPCVHASPSWVVHPQYLVSILHTTKPGVGPSAGQNHLLEPWTECRPCFRSRNGKHEHCMTFEFTSDQAELAMMCNMQQIRAWRAQKEGALDKATLEFRDHLNRKVTNAKNPDARYKRSKQGSSRYSQNTRGDTASLDERSSAISRRSKAPTLIKSSPLARAPATTSDIETVHTQSTDSSSEDSESDVETPAISPAVLPSEPRTLVDEFSTLSITVPAPGCDVLDATPDSAITPKRVSFAQATAAGAPRTPTKSVRSGRFGAPSRLLGKALASVTGKGREAADEDTGRLSSPTTPTDNGWRVHHRRGSRGSQKSTATKVAAMQTPPP